MSNQKLQAAQSQVEAAGYRWKHLSVALNGNQTIAEVLETPDAWSALQTDRVRCLSKGDKVSIISADGLVLADQAIVTKALAGSVWFSKPLRMVSLEEVALFSDDKHRIIAVGTGYSIQTLRDGRTDEKIFGTPKAAEAEIHRRAPVSVA
jgi:hypothetical protein